MPNLQHHLCKLAIFALSFAIEVSLQGKDAIRLVGTVGVVELSWGNRSCEGKDRVFHAALAPGYFEAMG